MARSLIALVAVAALAGCSSAAPGEVKLGVSVAPMVTAGTNGTTTTAGSDSALAITRVRVLVAHAKIGYTGDQASGPSAEIGPIVVDLTQDEIANGAKREFSLGTLPGGTYGGAEIEIEPLDADADTSDPALADFVSSGASVLIDGTYNGAAFSFAGHFLAEQGTDGDVTVDAATPVALDLGIDPSQWFAGSDPTDTAQHSAQAVAICKTLDTEPQTGGGQGPGPHPLGHGSHGGGPGGGPGAHCVEP